jgi:hypothetical protein
MSNALRGVIHCRIWINLYLEINSDGKPVSWHSDLPLGQWCTISNFSMRTQTSLQVLLSFLVVPIGTMLTNQLLARAEKPQTTNQNLPDWINTPTKFPHSFPPNSLVSGTPVVNSVEAKTFDDKDNSNKLLPIISQATGFDQQGKVLVQSAEPMLPPPITVPDRTTLPETTPTIPASPGFTITPPKKSPVKDSPFRLFGWETAKPIGQDNLLLQFGGTSFNNPYDFRGGTGRQVNRSNDAALDLVYGLGKDGQIGVSLAGKDDTIFSNLVRPNSQLQLINNSIPVQAKWRFYDQSRLQGAIVAGAEFPAPFSSLFFRPQRSIEYSQTAAGGVGVDRILAPNNSVVWGVGLPVFFLVSWQFHRLKEIPMPSEMRASDLMVKV